MHSILFPDEVAKAMRSYTVKTLVEGWKSQYGMDVAAYFQDMDLVTEYQCPKSDLYFFSPESMAGNGSFYKELMVFDWYYLEEKWEYEKILSTLEPGLKVLEIGCGSGAFLNRCLQKKIEVIGLELNLEAVAIGRQKGYPILAENLFDFVKGHSEEFDVVVCFQVLEHIPDPKPFIEACLKCLKKNGQLIFSVPNSDISLIRKYSILNAPPHHMLGWTAKSFKALEALFPLSLYQIAYEPLSLLHISWYLNIKQQTDFLLRQWLRWLPLKSLSDYLLRRGLRHWVKGHSHIAFYRKA